MGVLRSRGGALRPPGGRERDHVFLLWELTQSVGVVLSSEGSGPCMLGFGVQTNTALRAGGYAPNLTEVPFVSEAWR